MSMEHEREERVYWSGAITVDRAAWQLARVSEVVYEDTRTVQTSAAAWGLPDVRWIESKICRCVIFAGKEAVVVAFRGTDPLNLRDWLIDLAAEPAVIHSQAWRVHKGFSDSVLSIFSDLLQYLDRELGGRPLYLTGHSKGGAEATLAAMLLERLGVRITGVYTFGSPRVGDTRFAADYDATLRSRTYRYRNNNDVVTRVPLSWPRWVGQVLRALGWWLPPCGYRHVGQLRYFDADGNLHEKVTPWFRFIDAVDGRFRDLGRLWTDGIKDHFVREYVRLCRHQLIRTGELQVWC